MGENARKRLAADFRLMGYTEGGAQRQRNDLLAADPQLEADIELGAALNSEAGVAALERAIRASVSGYKRPEAVLARNLKPVSILAALRELIADDQRLGSP